MRTTIALLLGGWLLGTLLMAGVATQNFFLIDRLLSSPATHPSFLKHAAQMPPGEARTVLRYFSSELNRYYFGAWAWIQLVLAVMVLALAVFELPQRKFFFGFSAMLGLVAVMLFYITPEITQLGRSLDFVPREPPPPGLRRFGILHAAYSFLDLGKLLLGIWMAVAMVRTPGQTSPPSDAES